jgi:type 1 fimbriae regulatory protein FimB
VILQQSTLPEDPAGRRGTRTFLTEAEMKRFLAAARGSRHAARDHVMMLVAYRHGLRVSELIDVRLSDLDLEAGRLYVRRKKGSLSAYHPIEGDELRALRAWLRHRGRRNDAESSYLFLSERGPMTRQAVNYLVGQTAARAGLDIHVHPQMLRHSAGYHLAGRNCETRVLQDYLGHKNIVHAAKYKRATAGDFEGLWR